MYVIIAKKTEAGTSRGHSRVDNIVVETVKLDPDAGDGQYEVALAKKLNDLVNEGSRGDHHEIVQVIWK